ncbi:MULTISPECIES: extracellular solute-binding protein [unclassified Streptomyces]|uniref:sugar ABC transporter substrate-binding protein n=1 Tax=unclassified Streptomyces TaxID=2593676 RepID=UPI0030776798
MASPPPSGPPTGRLSRRGLLGAALAAAGGAALTGCSGRGGTADGGTALRFLGPNTAESLRPLTDAYRTARPRSRVDYTAIPPTQLSDVLQLRLTAKDTAIDVYFADQPRVPALAARGFLTDLGATRHGTDARARAAVSEEQYTASSWDGHLWSLPLWTSTQYLFHNTRLLNAAGVRPPHPDPADRWTWEEVTEAGRRTQDRTGAQYALVLEQIQSYYCLQPLVEGLGGGSGITGDDMLAPAVTTDGWVRAMTWYGRLFADGLAPRAVTQAQTSSLFSTGKAAFFVGGPSKLSEFAAVKGLDWGVAPLPYFADGRPVTPTGSWSIGVNPYSLNAEEAGRFTEFASLDPEGNLASVAVSPLIPANREAFDRYTADLERHATRATEGVPRIMRHELAHTAVSRPRSIGYTQFETVMGSAFSDIRNGSPADSRLADAADELVRTWERLR